MHIGNFGVDRPPLEADFGWFGATIRVEPNLTDTVLVEFLRKASTIENDIGPEAMSAIQDFLSACIHPDDFEEFWQLGRDNRQGIQDLMLVAYGILEVATDRPTPVPAASSGGQPTTPVALTENSSVGVVQRQFEERRRPDLALVVVQAQEALKSRREVS